MDWWLTLSLAAGGCSEMRLAPGDVGLCEVKVFLHEGKKNPLRLRRCRILAQRKRNTAKAFIVLGLMAGKRVGTNTVGCRYEGVV